jgi:hypothetical protein
MPNRASTLSQLSSADLQRELRNRERRVKSLQRRRATLLAQIEAVEDKIASLGVAGSLPRGKRRFRNEQTLVEVLARVLKGKTMAMKEIMEQVLATGYKTTSRHFRTQIALALIKSGKFKRKGRGLYTAR